ncbi:MAG: AraC family transcriptional regulator [Acidimicrobiales bacterium]|nr:AraC family transcriptional regulator [Acidimicrobiales bacterium]
MVVWLDTRDLPADHRRDAIHDAYVLADVPRQVSLLSQEAVDTTRIEGWMFGTMKLFCPDSPGMDVVRSGPTRRLDPMIAFCLQMRGIGRSIEDDRRVASMPGDLVMISPTLPNQFVIHGATAAVEIPFEEMGVSIEIAQRACERLPASPLFALVGRHLLSLRRDADAISSSAGAPDVGLATTNLLRALIVSAATDELSARSALADALAPRIFAYVRQHLTDGDLTPAKIARVHNISVRYLYKLCDEADVTLMDWVMQERLDGARGDLTSPDGPGITVAAVARRWGFKDASHFSQRFRRAYGVAPREVLHRSRRHH